MKARQVPPSLKKLLKRQARLTGRIMAHPAAATEAIQWFQEVMQECATRAAGAHSMELEEETDEPAFVWPETLDEVL